MNAYFVGADFGQVRDYSTIAVVERAELRGEFDPAYWAWRKVAEMRLRHLERIPLGTTYRDVAARVAEVTHKVSTRGKVWLAVDGTGVGRAVLELLQQARPSGTLMPAVITHGERGKREDGFLSVPKRDLIVGMQVMLQEGTLRIARQLPFGETLVEELQSMEVRVSRAGREQFDTWREGAHDDLVFAVALACWAAKEAFPWRRDQEYWLDRQAGERAEVFRKVVRERE
jgi:hypothetical protein